MGVAVTRHQTNEGMNIMTGIAKRAKVLSDAQIKAAIASVTGKPTAPRDRTLILLSVRAGLRACEMVRLTWSMVTDVEGEIGTVLALPNVVTKGRTGGRDIPLHDALRAALGALKPEGDVSDQRIILDARGFPMTANACVQWFHRLFAGLGFDGASSHSGRRTLITRLAKTIVAAGGTLRDVQMLAGHSTLNMTAAYIDADAGAQARAIRAL